MSHLSPTVFVTWAILVACLGGFYFYHLWKFDRFACLDVRRMRDGHTFKRVMTYSYLVALPVLMSYTVGFAVIKYQEGYIVISEKGQVFPKPFELWSKQHQDAYFPLNIFWALSWVAETVSHLEELCFWLYLIHSGPSPKPWFKSAYCRLWLGGCITALISLMVVTVATKSDPLKNEAYMQFTGSTISLFITAGFLPILWVFPTFIQSVKNDGGDMQTVVRLAKFHDLNIIRTVFRFLFVVPILMLSIDGMTPHTHELNETFSLTEFLSILSGISCIVQSAITLMIFFPRNLEMETERWLRPDMNTEIRALPTKWSKKNHNAGDQHSRDSRSKYLLTDSPIKNTSELPPFTNGNDWPQYTHEPFVPNPPQKTVMEQPYPSYFVQQGVHSNDKPILSSSPPMTYVDHDREQSLNAENGIFRSYTGSSHALTETNLRAHESTVSQVNPLALYFTSPLEVMSVSTKPRVRKPYLLP